MSRCGGDSLVSVVAGSPCLDSCRSENLQKEHQMRKSTERIIGVQNQILFPETPIFSFWFLPGIYKCELTEIWKQLILFVSPRFCSSSFLAVFLDFQFKNWLHPQIWNNPFLDLRLLSETCVSVKHINLLSILQMPLFCSRKLGICQESHLKSIQKSWKCSWLKTTC